METPQSTRIVARSHTLLSSANNENLMLTRRTDESENSVTKLRKTGGKMSKQDRLALVDLTNDSPIVGLAMGNLETPSSAISKKRYGGPTRTPGSGETLLRGQVKTLLQKVDEEAEVSKITVEKQPFFNLRNLISTPLFGLAAPTPVNTPEVLIFDGEQLIPQMVGAMSEREDQEEAFESENLIIRSLLQDFSEKSEECEDEKFGIKYASVEEENGYEEDDWTFNEFCEEMNKISVSTLLRNSSRDYSELK